MARYVERTNPVEAFQFDGDFMNSKGHYYVPDWGLKAVEIGQLLWEGQGELFIKTLQQSCLVDVGSYVVRNCFGDISVMSKKDFEGLYEQL